MCRNDGFPLDILAARRCRGSFGYIDIYSRDTLHSGRAPFHCSMNFRCHDSLILISVSFSRILAVNYISLLLGARVCARARARVNRFAKCLYLAISRDGSPSRVVAVGASRFYVRTPATLGTCIKGSNSKVQSRKCKDTELERNANGIY